MDRLFDVEVNVTQTRVYKNIPASNAGTAEVIIAELVEEDPTGMDGDAEYEVVDSMSDSVFAYVSEDE
jgi:hypothetical protein